jgi:O-antigen/teichoic acid export membrane protein
MALSVPVFAYLSWHLREYCDRHQLIAWRRFWPQARAYYASGFVRYAATQGDQMMVAFLFPSETLAPYFLLRRLYSAAVILISAGVDVVAPSLRQFALSGTHVFEREQARMLKKAATLGVVGGCVAAANVGWVVPLLVGPAYAPSATLTAAMLMAALSYGLFSFVLVGELVAGTPRRTLLLVTLAAAVPLAMAPALMPLVGVTALPLAMTAGYLGGAWCGAGARREWRHPAWLAHASIASVWVLSFANQRANQAAWHPWLTPAVMNTSALLLAFAVVAGYQTLVGEAAA